MIRNLVAAKIQRAVEALVAAGQLPNTDSYPAVEIQDTKQPEHGDFATNWAMVATKLVTSAAEDLRADPPSNPRALGELLASELLKDSELTRVEVAGPGFVNLTLSEEVLERLVQVVLENSEGSILDDSRHFARPASEVQGLTTTNPQLEAARAPSLKINLEYVSVNPNGPITIGSGRGAAYGSTLANVLQAAGHTIHREYYINDGVNSEQMRLFAESVKALCEDRPVPDNGYKGDYVVEVADQINNSNAISNYSAKQGHDEERLIRIKKSLTALNLLPESQDTLNVSERDLLHVLAQSLGVPYVDVDRIMFDPNLKAAIPFELSERLFIAPIKLEENLLWFVSCEPEYETAKVAIEAYTGQIAQVALTTCHGVRLATSIVYGGNSSNSDKSEEPKREASSVQWYQQLSQGLMLAKQRTDLETFGVTFDTWFSEQSLHDSGAVEKAIKELEASGVADTKETRTKVKYAKGGAIEEVEKEVQEGAVDEEGELGTGTRESNPTLSKPKTPTLWLRSTLFGDDQDRVLKRQDGRLTYIASDVAYHEDKFNRPPNADKLITVLGPDHHGYINRLHAVVAAALMSEAPSSSPFLGDEEGVGGGEITEQEAKLYGTAEFRERCLAARKLSDEKLKVMIFQLVRFMKDGKPAPMRKRDGNIYALIDLINEIGAKVKPNGTTEEKQTAGKDVARFFYLMRHHDTTFDFDLDLAERQSDENPVFYVQYAHARVCSVIEKAREAGFSGSAVSEKMRVAPSVHPKERALILKIADLSYEVQRSAEDFGVNRLATYAVELARTYHHFYDACRVIDLESPETSLWRLQLCFATKSALRAAFDLLGISAPERMDRANPETN